MPVFAVRLVGAAAFLEAGEAGETGEARLEAGEADEAGEAGVIRPLEVGVKEDAVARSGSTMYCSNQNSNNVHSQNVLSIFEDRARTFWPRAVMFGPTPSCCARVDALQSIEAPCTESNLHLVKGVPEPLQPAFQHGHATGMRLLPSVVEPGAVGGRTRPPLPPHFYRVKIDFCDTPEIFNLGGTNPVV